MARWPPRDGSYYGRVVYNEALASRVRTVLAGQPEVDEKKMFGGLCFLVDGLSSDQAG